MLTGNIRTACRVVVAATLLVPALAVGQEVGQQQIGAAFTSPGPSVPTSLQTTYEQLASSWRSGNAREIAQLAREGRVYVVVQRQDVSQRLAASQLQYLLDEMFGATEEVEFRFPAYTVYDANSRAGYAVGERVYREGPEEEPRTERVFIGARSERGRWVMTELRITAE